MNEQDLIETRKVLEEMGIDTVSSMRDILIQNNKSATGKLINSLAYTITYNGQDLSIEFSMEDYGIFVDQGRKPGKQPPISSISSWLQVKGLPQRWAFPIARKIGKFGIKPTPFFSSTIDEKQATYINRLAEAYSKDLENYISKNI